MNPLKLYADLQLNPNSIATYRKLADFYKNQNMSNEQVAFEALIRKMLNDSPNHPERREDNSENAGVNPAHEAEGAGGRSGM